MLEIKSLRSKEFYEYFEKLAPEFSKYRKRHRYFWRNIVKYCNYYIQDEDTVIEPGTNKITFYLEAQTCTGDIKKLIENYKDNGWEES